MDTEKKDLIGIVKELQAMRAYGIEHVHDDTRVSARNVPEVEWLYWHRLEKEFPNIAQAILIAVEALERIDEAEWSPCHECEGRSELVFIAGKALSGIRSLPKK